MALCYAKAFNFNYHPFIYFCFYFPSFSRQIQKILVITYVKECSALFIVYKSFMLSTYS